MTENLTTAQRRAISKRVGAMPFGVDTHVKSPRGDFELVDVLLWLDTLIETLTAHAAFHQQLVLQRDQYVRDVDAMRRLFGTVDE